MEVYTYSGPDELVKRRVRSNSPLGELERQICKALNLTRDHQHDISFEDDSRLPIACEEIYEGILTFAKESTHGSGTKLDLITETIKDFYESKGFVMTDLSKGTHKPLPGLVIPKDYNKYVFMRAVGKQKNPKKYTIQVSQGDDYSVYITESKLDERFFKNNKKVN